MASVLTDIDATTLSAAQAHLKTEPGMQLVDFENGKIAFDFEPSQEETKELLVLINGYQRTRQDFRAFRKRLKSLSKSVATLALDNRGCGQTENLLPEIDVARMARDAHFLATAFKRKLNLSHYSALGISMGGMIAQTLASGNADVNRLFLVSTTAGGHGRVWPDSVHNPEAIRFEPWPQDKATLSRRMRKYFGERFLQESPLLFDLMVTTMLKGFENADKVNARSQLQFSASAFFDGTSLLQDISAKTLVVTGDEDWIIPKENAYFMQAHIPDAQLIEYPQTGHLILIEEPEKIVADVAKFLQEA